MCVTLMELEKFLSKAEYMSVILKKSPSLCREHRTYIRKNCVMKKFAPSVLPLMPTPQNFAQHAYGPSIFLTFFRLAMDMAEKFLPYANHCQWQSQLWKITKIHGYWHAELEFAGESQFMTALGIFPSIHLNTRAIFESLNEFNYGANVVYTLLNMLYINKLVIFKISSSAEPHNNII